MNLSICVCRHELKQVAYISWMILTVILGEEEKERRKGRIGC